MKNLHKQQLLEIAQEIGKITVNITTKEVEYLKSQGYILELDPSTDFYILTKDGA